MDSGDLQDAQRKAERSFRNLRASLPPELFEPRLSKSLLALFQSISAALVVGSIACWLAPDGRLRFAPGSVVGSALFWSVYAAAQGTIATGLWVLAHECGHRAFAKSALINDAIGFALHSALLVPFFSWKLSHQKHHKYTNSLWDGETHVPPLKQSRWVPCLRVWHRAFPNAFPQVHACAMLALGWPAYLWLNETGGHALRDTPSEDVPWVDKNHFVALTTSKLFPGRQVEVALSALGVSAALAFLWFWAGSWGALLVGCLYGPPLLVVNGWLVFITYLQHTSVDVPHYGPDAHGWHLGALATVDRQYPELIDRLHFHIGSTHVVHHLFPSLPHYNAPTATAIARRVLGDDYYRFDSTPLWRAFVTTVAACGFVEGLDGRQFWRPWR